MSKTISKAIKKICEKVGSDKIMIMTNSLKIDGKLYIEDGKCDECHENILTLTDVTICRLKDYCTCDGENCTCDDYICFKYDWLNVNIDKIVLYSVLG